MTTATAKKKAKATPAAPKPPVEHRIKVSEKQAETLLTVRKRMGDLQMAMRREELHLNEMAIMVMDAIGIPTEFHEGATFDVQTGEFVYTTTE